MSDTGTTRGLERRQLLMIAALGFVLLALVYFVFLKGGSEEPSTAPLTGSPPIAQAQTDDPFEPEAGGDASKQPVETFEIFASRDPFEPVVGQGSSKGGDEGDQGSASPPNDDPGQAGPSNDDNEPSTPQTDDGVAGHSVSLIDVFREGGKDKAQVQVDSTGYTVMAGDVFAENFQLVSTSGRCATLLYGDDQFTLCEGEQILK